MNQTYLHVYDILDNAEILEAKLQSALEDLERNEESMRRLEATKASRVESLRKSTMRMKSSGVIYRTVKWTFRPW